MKRYLGAKENWSSHHPQCGTKNKMNFFMDFNTFFEDAKQFLRSTNIGAKGLKVLEKLKQTYKAAHTTSAPKQSLLCRISASIGWGFLAQLLLELQFHILVNINFHLMDWLSDMYCGMKSICYMHHLITISICIICYDFLISEICISPTKLRHTRSDRILYAGWRKLLLFSAQLALSLLLLHTYYYQKNGDQEMSFMQYAVVFVTAYNFCRIYLFEDFNLHFDLVIVPSYEQLCLMLRPPLWIMLQRVFAPFLKFTLGYFVVVNLDKYQSWPSFSLTSIDFSTVYQALLLTALTQQSIFTLESLVRFKLTQPMEFAVKDGTGKALLFEALKACDSNHWIFGLATRDFLSLSLNKTRYLDLWTIPCQKTQYLWNVISGQSLERVRQYTKALSHNYESPEKLVDTDFVERILNDNNTQHIFKRIRDRDSFIISLTKAPTLCSCPLGPARPIRPKIDHFLSGFFWFHIELAYKLLERSRIIHLYHFLYCPTFGVSIRYLLQDSETIECLLQGLTNVSIAALQDNKRHVIKGTISPFIKVLLEVVQVTELVTYNRHELFGLDEEAYGKLKSLKSHAKSSLFRLMEGFRDQLLLFVQEDTIEEINRLVGLNKKN